MAAKKSPAKAKPKAKTKAKAKAKPKAKAKAKAKVKTKVGIDGKAKRQVETGYRNLTEMGVLLEVHRDTLRKYIKKNQIPSSQGSGVRNPEYKVSELARVLFIARPSGPKPVEEMNSEERDAHFRAANRELAYLEKAKVLCHMDDVRETNAEMVKALSEAVKSFTDVAERDHGAGPAELKLVDLLCNKLLVILAETLE